MVMAPADSTSSPRDHVADANPDLARKKQRLSEDPGASPSDSVVIEACEPEDLGTNMDNAIEIDEDSEVSTVPYSQHFIPSLTRSSALEQICELLNQIQENRYVKCVDFIQVSQALTYHVERTSQEDYEWKQRYLDDEADFFTKFAILAWHLLEAEEIFHPQDEHDTLVMRKAIQGFLRGLEILCCRVIPHLPDMIKSGSSRRDSALVPSRPQPTGGLYFVAVAARISSLETPTVTYFRKYDRRLKIEQLIDHISGSFAEPGINTALAALACMLGGAMSEIKEWWLILHHLLNLFNITVQKRCRTGHTLDPEIEAVMEVINASIRPAICEKHPRSLPDNFHNNIISFGASWLHFHVQSHDEASAADLYERFLKSESDALIPEADDNDTLISTLRRLCDANQDILAQLLANSWSMQTAKAFICSDIMDIRTIGLASLRLQLVRLYNESKSLPHGLDSSAVQYGIRFLRKNEIISYIFGPESRAGLVSQSPDIICFLAATFSYTNAETDTVWRACSTSVEADFVKASFQTLRRLTDFLEFEHLLYIAKKYSITPLARFAIDAVEFLHHLLKVLEQKSYSMSKQADKVAMAFASIDILKNANSSEPSVAKDRLRQVSMAEIFKFAGQSSQLGDRMAIYKHCIPDIKKRTEDATAAIEALSLTLKFCNSPEEAHKILDMLPTHAAVEELCKFVEAKKGQPLLHPPVMDIIVRLECIVQLMALTTAAPNETTQEFLFDYVFGNAAFSNILRDSAWEKLICMAALNNPQSVAKRLLSTYMQHHVPSIGAEVATPRLIEPIVTHLKLECENDNTRTDLSRMLSYPLWETLLRFATSSPDDTVVNMATGAIIDLLFLHPIATSVAPTTIAECHSKFVEAHIERLRSLREGFTKSKSQLDPRNFLLAVNLLAAILTKSRDDLSLYGSGTEADMLNVGDAGDEDGRITFTAEICGPATHPTTITIQAKVWTKVSELLAKLSGYTSAVENRVIAGGVEITGVSDKTLSEAGIQPSGVILIRPRYTFDLDLGKVLTKPGPVEHAILAQYTTLQAFLDGADVTAQQSLLFLQNVRLPSQVRLQVTSASATASDLFPKDNPTRTRFSLFVLRTHLSDFARLGVVDSDFILRAVRLLTEFILCSSHTFDPLLMLDALETLSITLRERPRTDASLEYFEDCGNFASSLINVLYQAKNMPIDMGSEPLGKSIRIDLAAAAYQALLLACQTSDPLWKAFVSHEAIVSIHTQLVIDHDLNFSARLTQPIRNLCQDTNTSRHVPEFYWRVLHPGLPAALANSALAENYFNLAVDILHSEEDISGDEAKIRCLVESLVSELRHYKHKESPPLIATDKAMVGLLRLLQAATVILRSHKKPLELPGLSVCLLRQFLFPPQDDPQHSPLISEETRGLAYDLIRSTFESEADYQDLIDNSRDAVHGSVRESGAKFPALSDWIRPFSNGAGLNNLGMTCYMNSLLQQLYGNLQFRKFILDQRIQDPHKQDILAEVQALFAQMQNSLQPVSDPARLATALNIQIGSQEDVHTFYTTLLTKLEENMPDGESRRALTGFFTGKSVTQVKGDCGHVSSRMEPFTELSITVKNKASLCESLDEFVQGEPLEGANKYKCMTCASGSEGRLVNALKRTCLEEVPDNLTFCLKRFAFDTVTEGENKVNDRFEFPTDIDMSMYKREHLEDPGSTQASDTFELVGVIVHQGSLSYGHYWSYARVPGSGDKCTSTWVYLEDNKFSRCVGGVQEVQEQCFGGLRWCDGSERPESGYVLFYQRKEYARNANDLNSVPHRSQIEDKILPMVEIQEPLATHTNKDNLWRLNMSSLFSDQFSSFVLWLLGQFQAVVETRQTRLEAYEGEEHAMATMRDALNELEAKICDLISSYVLRIFLADPKCDNKLGSLMSLLEKMLQVRPTIAPKLLEHLAQDPFAFETIVRHEDKNVRAQIFSFVETCMSSFRQQHQDNYDDIMALVIGAHSSLLMKTLDSAPGLWEEYFNFAANFANLGVTETRIILDSGYLDWVFEVLYLSCDGNCRRKHAKLYNWTRNNDLDLSALFGFLFELLSGHIDLSESFEQLNLMGDGRSRTTIGWCLRDSEIGNIFKDRPHKATNIWLLFQSGVRHCSIDVAWRDYAPGKLIGLLVGHNTHVQILRWVEHAMSVYYDYEEMELGPLLFMTLHFCLNRSDDECKVLLKALSKNLVLWETQERRSLWFLREAYAMAPTAVVESVQVWVKAFLRAKHLQCRQAAVTWLQDHVFGPGPISDDAALDASRIRTTRTFVISSISVLGNAYNTEESRNGYESMIKSMEHAREYLTNLELEVSQREQDPNDSVLVLSPEVRAEAAEATRVLTALEHSLEDLSNWETDLPTRTIGVRRSVEEEYEVSESSEGEGDEINSELEG